MKLMEDLKWGGIHRFECICCGAAYYPERYECPCGSSKFRKYLCGDVRKVKKFIKELKDKEIDLRDLGLTYEQGVAVWQRVNSFIDELAGVALSESDVKQGADVE